MARPGACLLFLGEVGGSCVAVSDSGKSKREKDIEEIGKEGSGRRMREEAGNGKKRKERKRLALTAVLLFICVAATAAIVVERLSRHAINDAAAIALVPSEVEKKAEAVEESRGNLAVSDSVGSQAQPGAIVSDSEKVWGTETQVEIFHITYEDSQRIVTVNSGDGDKVIAPGTENAYTFWLKNTGNTAVDYEMELEAYLTPDKAELPVDARMKSYEGAYLLGNDSKWDSVLKLDGIRDKAPLGVNRYAQYTLEWQWPYESGDDDYDTWLGNQAVNEDIALTIVIRTTASANIEPGAGGGLPKTGDTSNITFYIILAGAALFVMVLILFLAVGRRGEQEEDAQEDRKN